MALGRSRLSCIALTLGSVWLAACSSTPAAPTGGPGTGAPVNPADPGAGTAGSPSGTPPVMVTPGIPPAATNCGGSVLPNSYNAVCNTCHTQSGTANSRYPDLYEYAGTLEQFTQQVRMGSVK